MKKIVIFLLWGMSVEAQEIKPGQIYRHYKGKLYKVLAVAVDTESKWIDDPAQITDQEKRIIYQGFGSGHALSTEIVWDRPYEMFAGVCASDNKTYKRFELMNANDITLQTYEQSIEEYTAGRIAQVAENKVFQAFVDATLDLLPKSARIIEIGSGFGRDAEYIESHGFYVERTEAVQGFIDLLKDKGYSAHLFNILTDDFDVAYNLVFANAVFLHFTPEQFQLALHKIRKNLLVDGLFAFSVQLGDGDEWRALKNGNMRYFYYWRLNNLTQLLHDAGFGVIASFNDGKFLDVIARKK